MRAKSKSTNSGSGLIVRPPPVHREGAIISDGFISSKKDKRLIKHSAFVNRIEKAHKKPLKRRRPNKKLVTTLESLGDALDELQDLDGGLEKATDGKIRMRGLKSRPGAMKRKEKLEKQERERFGKNMAQLAAGAGARNAAANADAMAVEEGVREQQQPNATAGRWAALRGFISQTMEQKEEFAKSS